MPVYTPPLGAPYATGWDWIERVRAHTDTRGHRALVDGAMDASTTTLALTYPPAAMDRGVTISVGLESMYVWAWDPVASVATVLRGADQSTKTAHNDQDLAYIAPRWTTQRIWIALQEEVASFPSQGLWAISTIERVFDPDLRGLDLTNALVGDRVVQVQVKRNSDTWGEWDDVVNWKVATDLSVEDYPSGRAIYLQQALADGDRVRIVYRNEPSRLLDPDLDPVSQTGIEATAGDIPSIGAAIRLIANQPVYRANPNVAPSQRAQNDVTTQDTLNSATLLRATKQQRIEQEKSLLHARYATKLTVRTVGGYRW